MFEPVHRIRASSTNSMRKLRTIKRVLPVTPDASSTIAGRPGIRLAVLPVIALLVALAGRNTLATGHYDFNAFYCAARTLAAGADPYRFGPLSSCERASLPLPAHAAVPAPLPPYAIAAFVPLALLAFPVANAVWIVVLLLAAAAIAWSIVRFSGLPYWLAGICSGSAFLVEPLMNGALAPVPVALLCVAAVALAKQRWTLSAACLGAACVQPHVAAPAMLAAFVLVPRMRGRIAVVAGTIAALSLAAGGPQTNAEYALRVLPAHAVSELGTAAQYGLSALVHLSGASVRVALLAGTIQYAAFVVAGIVLARSMMRTHPEAIVLVPLAFAVTGGTFVHQSEVAGALPLALLLAGRGGSIAAWWSAWLLAIPWEFELATGFGIAGGVVTTAVVAYRRRPLVSAIGAGAAVAIALLLAHARYPMHLQSAPLPPVAAGALAEAGWRPIAEMNPPRLLWLPSHLLTYAGLVCAFAAAFLEVRRQRTGAQHERPCRFA